MKNTGMVRRTDELGRIIIPKETRKQFGIKKGDLLEFYTESKEIRLKIYEQNCMFCGNTNNLIEFQDRLICQRCINNINKHMR